MNWRKATLIDLDAYSDAVSSNLLNLPIYVKTAKIIVIVIFTKTV